mmetsp:Transcript_38840/g.47032  ORF Transcript_38840/g.47032 Transcript_38840/m.47032 type:complete len:321 (-) Transcript_38840:482-1444(-)|eukprot:CAMPEP_0197847120 /NCGR_PEP_ID=MMETSP1438-20131217/5215_1 /TAXON_ID=1461541 /ORGANISM="Pterosperma sp., Strain CCMP1384" /LENGTH=320 /DNA_ID=CAMNT_0043458951 /DNA_START=210 /DNA_END=1172 /DNA_ORIENTATION=+
MSSQRLSFRCFLLVLAVLSLSWNCIAQEADEGGSEIDNDDFWGQAYDEYYEYSDYLDSYIEEDCFVEADGSSFLNGTACDLIVTGNDLMTKYSGGGVHGTYTYQECKNGRPMYVRDAADGPPMYIIYSDYWGDWDFSNTSALTDVSVVGYGGEGFGENRPEDITEQGWYVLKLLTDTADSENDFIPAPELRVQCKGYAEYNPEVHENGLIPTCQDGVQNGDETGVDCGGTICVSCEVLADIHETNLEALRKKIQDEYVADAQAQQRSRIAQGVVALMAIIGFGLVCGGPLLYLFKMMQAQREGTMYRGVQMQGRRAPGRV